MKKIINNNKSQQTNKQTKHAYTSKTEQKQHNNTNKTIKISTRCPWFRHICGLIKRSGLSTGVNGFFQLMKYH